MGSVLTASSRESHVLNYNHQFATALILILANKKDLDLVEDIDMIN